MKRLCTTVAALLMLVGCGKSSTAPSSASSSFPSKLMVFSSSSPSGPWGSAETVTVTGHDALGLVDPSPIRMPDGSVLLYYLMSYQSTTDPASSQPNNQWKFGVARSTTATTFVHQGVAYTHSSSAADPFPMMLDANGTLRLLIFAPGATSGPSLFSVTATDSSGLRFGSIDPGFQAPAAAGAPGALKIGSTYFLYRNGSYYTSSDGLNFSFGGSLGLAANFDSPIDAGGGTYLMAYVCEGLANPTTQVSCLASSTDGRTWTQVSRIGLGGVPGLVKDASGVLRVYVVVF